jgi:hypothetical protein
MSLLCDFKTSQKEENETPGRFYHERATLSHWQVKLPGVRQSKITKYGAFGRTDDISR